MSPDDVRYRSIRADRSPLLQRYFAARRGSRRTIGVDKHDQALRSAFGELARDRADIYGDECSLEVQPTSTPLRGRSEWFGRDLEARGRSRATITRRVCIVAGFYHYAVEEELLDHSPATHVLPRLHYQSHATGPTPTNAARCGSLPGSARESGAHVVAE